MPMYRSAVFGACDFVTDVHGNSIAPISFDRWTRECPIDKSDISRYSIRRDLATSDVEIVRGTLTACRNCQHTRKSTEDVMLLTAVEVCGVRVVVADCIGSPGNDTINPSD